MHTLTIAGAPIDFQAGAGAIHEYVRLLSPADMRFYEEVVRLGGGVLKGEFMLNGFITIKPENEIAKHLQLLNHIRDEEHVARHRAFEDWFKHTQDIPGDFYLWIVERLFRDNALVRGELEIDGRRVDLARHPLSASTCSPGRRTTSRRPSRCSRSPDAVSTPPEDIVQRVTSGGHLGLFMGREALRDHWPAILAACTSARLDDAGVAAAARASRRRPDPIPAP